MHIKDSLIKKQVLQCFRIWLDILNVAKAKQPAIVVDSLYNISVNKAKEMVMKIFSLVQNAYNFILPNYFVPYVKQIKKAD